MIFLSFCESIMVAVNCVCCYYTTHMPTLSPSFYTMPGTKKIRCTAPSGLLVALTGQVPTPKPSAAPSNPLLLRRSHKQRSFSVCSKTDRPLNSVFNMMYPRNLFARVVASITCKYTEVDKIRGVPQNLKRRGNTVTYKLPLKK